ncbi:P-loop containing nucleoside triphosphate hydrolase protein [Vararia minispora EC-137]|uniref:P-loop containing nucleoside triphosphate hydrolase protein n=1 Tax=Vararia minispora EC-137 TaxID=1314806 RepID=A0ACB8Q5N3_9AGAM|nr:P-loop containing nucleoside triphosphate hydrolase protein [Vararia minispora EC-137]
MSSVFLRQFGALMRKNAIVFSRNSLLNVLRCFILPVAYGVFLAVAQVFLVRPSNFGIGDPIPVYNLSSRFDGSLTLYWADATNASVPAFASPSDIMSRITTDFSPAQLAAVRKAPSADAIPSLCPQNFNLFSECFAAVVFNVLPSDATAPVNYTIRADGGLFHVDVVGHASDYEERIMPLQWAVDRAIVELRTGQTPPTPLEWPFTQETNEEQSTNTRLAYIRGLRTLLVLALFINYVGIAYQLPGAFMSERALGLTAHLKAMGLRDFPRILSWHISLSLAYLPAWIIVGLIWHYRIFSASSAGLILALHLLLGLSLTSWSFAAAAPFGKSPQLAAVSSTVASIGLAVLALVLGPAGDGTAAIFTLVFPPAFYVFTIRVVAGFEAHQLPASVTAPDPDAGMRLLPLIIVAIINIFLWPYIAVLIERRLYDARPPPSARRTHWWAFWRRKHTEPVPALPDGVAISVRNLRKTFRTRWLGRGKVVAVDDLSFDVPQGGIFVLLGSNGAGKSTTLAILANLLGATSGTVTFAPSSSLVTSALGIVPQKNVLHPDLTTMQTLRFAGAIKGGDSHEDPNKLLADCDLKGKEEQRAGTLSGGQMRKLQLAVGLVGGSKVVLVDECTSGVDPLSRRALWRTLTAVRTERTIVFTTHFLDEADLLADEIAILAAPGRLVAIGPPVVLKSRLGQGYTVTTTFGPAKAGEAIKAVNMGNAATDLLRRVRELAPDTHVTMVPPCRAEFHLRTRDTAVVERVLALLENERAGYGVVSYDVQGTSIEDVFLGLMREHEEARGANDRMDEKTDEKAEKANDHGETEKLKASSTDTAPVMLTLSNGRKRPALAQALTIFRKRALIVRRSWLTPLLMAVVAILGSCVPLFFMAGRPQSCTTTFSNSTNVPLYLPNSPLSFLTFFNNADDVLIAPPGLLSTLGTTAQFLSPRNVSDNATFVQTIRTEFRSLARGGVSFDASTGAALVAWEASPPGLLGPTMLNLASNLLWRRALNASGATAGTNSLILANYESFPAIDTGTLVALEWVAFFGAAMAVYPAFLALYVSRERRTAVQAMQFSNGLSNPAGLWLGHALFDALFVVAIATVIVVVFAVASNQFHGLGFVWLVLVLYGVAGAFFAYLVALATASPLAAFAVAAAYQIVMFTAYLAGYLLTLTYAKTSQASMIITTIHFTLSLLSPVASVLRTAFVSVNLFSLACTGNETVTASQLGVITRFGGPILYLILYSIALFVALVWVDSGSVLHRTGIMGIVKPRRDSTDMDSMADDVEKEPVESGVDEALRVLHVSKSFGLGRSAKTVVDDVSLEVPPDTIFALLGPNGAGKTTTFNVIRGDIVPDHGDVFLNGTSVVRHPRAARLALGVCPQFTAIDAQLTVREHLRVYGALKGLRRGGELERNVAALMDATGLTQYADRLASRLSGGNQRKLALTIALIGNPAVVLIDEFSTGIDAKMKREMWVTLRRVAVGKAIVITTHSMEEAAALANRVGILAKRLLASGTTDSLAERYAAYEVHFSCRTPDERVRAEQLMAHIPGAHGADDVATRFEVPITGELTLARLFHLLASHGDFAEYTVEKASLESVFLKVIRLNDIKEEDREGKPSRRWWRWRRSA